MLCPACNHAAPAGAKFCSECGAALAQTVVGEAEQRRLVTVVFFDLVGFTERSEQLDPEDVRAFLVPYYELLTREVERHGGIVDKFLGDGAMVVFGVPVAHEDDAVRAVQTALRVVERLPELGLDLHARVGITTGEALVAADALARGDAITGDTANTAARLQTVAPIGGVVVGERTWRATVDAFEYEEQPPASLKGKHEPVRVFRVAGVATRVGSDLIEARGRVFVGREAELGSLRGLFDEAASSQSARLAAVVGEPGLGKSRLLAELRAALGDTPVTWFQGRCLPYGEAITYWPLAEIVKAHAGILDSDPVGVVREKLERALPDVTERTWLRERLLPLLGLESSSGSAARPDELHAAWRLWVEQLAAGGPAVLVFEDLHWAEDGLLTFLESLAEASAPVLVLGTARPELFEQQPERLAGAPRVDLRPLTDAETGKLVAGLLETVMLPAEVQGPILERAAGNPLYAEEFVRLLRDRQVIVRSGTTWELSGDEELPLPESLQALIGARLDLLSPEERAMLADAAVIGKVFWAGAVAAIGERERTRVLEVLARLMDRELLRPARSSSFEGEPEFAFWHALVRDVAYGRLPRRQRAVRHVAAAEWIETAAGMRVEELAGVLAYHYSAAAELFRASGEQGLAGDADAGALRFVVIAGERALGFDTAAALANLTRAVELTPVGHPDRPDVLARFGEALFHAGTWEEAAVALREAVAGFRARGDVHGAARILTPAIVTFKNQRYPEAETLEVELLAELEPLGPTPELIAALTEVAIIPLFAGRTQEALALLDRALQTAAELGLPRPARSLGFLGWARCDLGDEGGLDDMREALDLAIEAGQGREVALLYNNLAAQLMLFEGPLAALEIRRRGIAYAELRGLLGAGVGLVPFSILNMIDAGLHDEALERLDERIRWATERSVTEPRYAEYIHFWRLLTARILVLRGQAAATEPWLDELVAWRDEYDSESQLMTCTTVAAARSALGQAEAAASLLTEIAGRADVRASPSYAPFVPSLVRTAVGLGEVEFAEELVAGVDVLTPLNRHSVGAARAGVEEAHGRTAVAAELYATAAEGWSSLEFPVEEAYAQCGAGRCLLALGEKAQAAKALERARALSERLQAAPLLAEIDALRARTLSLTA